MKKWFTCAELAGLGLADLPGTGRAVQMLAKRQGWDDADRECTAAHPLGVWRRRAGRGGGVEYHYSLLPSTAQARLVAVQAPAPEVPTVKEEVVATAMWAWFSRQRDRTKDKAKARLVTLQAVETLIRNGVNKDVAVTLVAAQRKVAASSIWGWYSRVASQNKSDWLPYLADRYSTDGGKEADCHPEAWDVFKGDYLRFGEPTATSCYDRLKDLPAVKSGDWAVPTLRTLMRRIEREIPAPVLVYARKGYDALKRMFPAQERDRSCFHALEGVNGDGHKFDVFVKWPDGDIGRPMMVGLQDLYSGKMLAWRVDKSENTEAIRLCFADLVADWGIPDFIYFDNTRAFANKAMTAGAQHRYRFKIKPEDPVGVITLMGSEVHFVEPYAGQSKPIERAWRDLADRVSRHPAFQGAYTGNNPTAKPEDYGTRAIPLDDFLKVLSVEMIRHNARPGRRAAICNGRSFDETFAESYEKSPIRKANPDQRRLLLLAAEGIRAHAEDGSLRFHGNRYWAEFLLGYRGQPVVIRFDPQDLVKSIDVYDQAGVFLGEAECLEAVGFRDITAARDHAKARRGLIKAQKALLEAERRLDAAAVAALQPDAEEEARPESKVVRLYHGNTALKSTAVTAPVPIASQDAEVFGRGVQQLLRIVSDNP